MFCVFYSSAWIKCDYNKGIGAQYKSSIIFFCDFIMSNLFNDLNNDKTFVVHMEHTGLFSI